MKLPHFVAENGSELVSGLVYDEAGKSALAIVLGDDLSELLSLDRTPCVVVGLEQHVADYFRDKLVLLLLFRQPLLLWNLLLKIENF